MIRKEEITGVILAGGKNSRMGSDKGMLIIDGVKIVERIIAALKPVVGKVMIISNGHNYDYLQYNVYPDIIKDCGPMGGIYTALSYSKTNKILVVSCDMPFIDADILTTIAKNANEEDIIIPEQNNGSLEPLCAIYSKTCKDKLEALLKSGDWKLKDALKYFNVKMIGFTEEQLQSKPFININTPAEYQSLNQNDHSS